MNLNTRRGFLSGAAAWMAAPSQLWAADKRAIKTVSLFHTTDLHGHILPAETYDGIGNVGGLARCATQIRKWRKDCPDNLLFDIGDVYQGTIEGYQTKGAIMIDAFNKMNYDGWVLGNHEFDWGLDVVSGAVERSQMPVITGNVTIDGKAPGNINGNPFSKLAPYVVKEVAGFKIGLVGLVTPGIPYWSRPELLKEFGVTPPLESLKQSVKELQSQKVDTIVCLGHMGWKRADDYANPVQDLLKKVPGIDIYIGGHTHQDRPSWYWSNVLCTQANYYGINCGRVDLSFDLESRKLVKRNAWTVLMDDRVAMDPLILESAKEAVATAEERRKVVIGEVKTTISSRGKTSPYWELLCKAFLASAAKHDGAADLVFHGTFGTSDVEPGIKTIDDAWKWLPYENWLVHATLTGAQIKTVVADAKNDRYSDRALYGIALEELVPDKRYGILFNSYDSQSGGRKMMKVREILQEKESQTKLLPINTREALVDWFLEHKKV
ncbi:bifunctional metallophosphatase/5'-nucleotidase [bacterium]|nr:bifunctional metallophosphatase/5'-nucleotidase [Akkermansiaceae bacterium]MDA7514502.1 bifunctional metallophosphatase/5'-nucleotidase [bacterium]MDA8959791.1 bifunctional metallophosphatase/5'-nucleotidase [Akkermansiaceae bacterium]MDB4267982.1 bifunctional metallophosphatase/5'-nucleotidase [Akkermansiaceae bacterium]MDB4288637.1 bifunctional metallophosphatase/5'-nucleotidase [bacterium]